jgi:ribosomal-protein-alanine N-acetyltransferase
MNALDVVLRPLLPADAPELLALHLRNRGYWRATAPLRDDDWFVLDAQRRRIEAEARDRAEGHGLFFGVVAGGRLAGRLSLSGIIRGAFLNAYLGYAVDEALAGRGVGTSAVRQAIALAWADGLHRVQAAVSPDNAGSKRVLEKVGFRREGLAERYLRLDGSWTDQELWAITVEDALR